MGFSFYDILNEADDDGAASAAPDTQDNMAAEPSENSDFNMDANLDNNDSSSDGGDDDLGDLNMDSDEGSGDSSLSDSGNASSAGGDNEEEPNENNTDMFFALSAEEQQIKIKELKGQYASLYQSCDDIINRLIDINVPDHYIGLISRVTTQLSNLKLYIADYLSLTFATKSFVENDFMFNRFLDIINSITKTIDMVVKKNEKDTGLDSKS